MNKTLSISFMPKKLFKKILKKNYEKKVFINGNCMIGFFLQGFF